MADKNESFWNKLCQCRRHQHHHWKHQENKKDIAEPRISEREVGPCHQASAFTNLRRASLQPIRSSLTLITEAFAKMMGEDVTDKGSNDSGVASELHVSNP